MTETAIHVLKDGSEEEIKIEKVTDEIAHDTYLCNGCGGNCRVKMYPVRNGREPHFHTKRNQHHKLGCLNDHSIAAQIVHNLDRTGRTTSMEDLFDRFSRVRTEAENDEQGRRMVRERGNNERDDQEVDDDRPILREPRDPRSLRELCALFTKSDLDCIYAGLRIGDNYIDRRNIGEVRSNGIPEGKLAIVLLAKISKARIDSFGLEVPVGAIVLGDAYYYEDRAKQLICIVPCASERVREGILRSTTGSIIAVFTRWRKYSSDKDGIYICDPINEGQFFCAEENFYEW